MVLMQIRVIGGSKYEGGRERGSGAEERVGDCALKTSLLASHKINEGGGWGREKGLVDASK